MYSNMRACVCVCMCTFSFLSCGERAGLRAGVPQGSILGPLLFLLFMNDIVDEIGCNIRLFSDDTSLYITVENPDMATELMNVYLDKIMKWAKNGLFFLILLKPNLS